MKLTFEQKMGLIALLGILGLSILILLVVFL